MDTFSVVEPGKMKDSG